MIDPLIKNLQKRVGNDSEILYYMDDMKASMTNIKTAQLVHFIADDYAASVRMVIMNKKCAIQLIVETHLPESIQDIPRLDETTNRHPDFEMKRGRSTGERCCGCSR